MTRLRRACSFPFGEDEDELVVHFDPESSLITSITALRYRDEESGQIPWRADFLEWRRMKVSHCLRALPLPGKIKASLGPYWTLEEYFWNMDISDVLPKGLESAPRRMSTKLPNVF